MKRQLSPDPIISREVDILDLPSQYTENIETFRQVLNIQALDNSLGKVLQILKELEHQAKQSICTLKFSATSALVKPTQDSKTTGFDPQNQIMLWLQDV